MVAEFLNLTQQRLPKILILDGGSIALYPAILDPVLGPFSCALNHILRIGREDKSVEPLAGPVSEAQGGDDSTELRPVAGLKTIVAERSLLLQAARGDESAARRANPVPETPACLWVFLAVA